MNNNYYQSDIRTSRQEDILLSIDDDRQRLLCLIKYWREECFKQDKQLKAYENMKKEAIEYTKSHFKEMVADEEAQILLDILNKVGSDK